MTRVMRQRMQVRNYRSIAIISSIRSLLQLSILFFCSVTVLPAFKTPSTYFNRWRGAAHQAHMATDCKSGRTQQYM